MSPHFSQDSAPWDEALVMMVDDEELLTDVIQTHLEDAGYTRFAACNAPLEALALIGIAEKHWNRDAPARRTLTEAVFPFYLVHQTIIVLVAYWLIPARLAGGAEFAVLIAATIVGCWAFYAFGRRIAILRPLIGLRPLSPPKAAS